MNATFSERLENLEREALVAVVPGDARQWCETVEARASEVAELWPDRSPDMRRLYEQIRAEDPALHARVDALGKEQDRLRAELFELRKELRDVARAHIGERYNRARALRGALIRHMAELRAHDGELLTWFGEAFYRDIGTAD